MASKFKRLKHQFNLISQSVTPSSTIGYLQKYANNTIYKPL